MNLSMWMRKVGLILPEIQDKKILVAVSGGPDSMALLHFLHYHGGIVRAAHVNYGLRGKESDRDEACVRTFCLKEGIPLSVLHAEKLIPVAPGDGLQEKARNLRYSWLENLRAEWNAEFVVTAHHASDSAETLIFHLLRGSGIRGLRGVPFRRGTIFRPFLLLSKGEIMNYIKDHKIPYVEDSSNQKNLYTRNRIRMRILPEMNKENAEASLHIAQTAFFMQGYSAWVTKFIRQEIQSCFEKKDNYILFHFPGNLDITEKAVMLFEWLKDYGFDGSRIFQILWAVEHPSGQEFASDAYQLKITTKGILIYAGQSEDKKKESFCIPSLEGPWPSEIESKVRVWKNPRESFSSEMAIIPVKHLVFPLVWRHPSDGDAFIPFGMKGRKKISDFLKDHGIKGRLKKHVWLLENGDGTILWVAPYRVHHLCKNIVRGEKVLQLYYKI